MTKSAHPARVYTNKAIKLIVGLTALGTAVVLPGSASLLAEFEKHMDKKSASKTLTYLKYRKMVDVKVLKDGQVEYKLTSKALARHKRVKISELSIKTPLKWDKKWRLVMFDVPSNPQDNYKRRQLTANLAGLGFYMIQKSAWIHPFECKEQVGILTDLLALDDHVSLLEVSDGNFIDHATEHFKQKGLLI